MNILKDKNGKVCKTHDTLVNELGKKYFLLKKNNKMILSRLVQAEGYTENNTDNMVCLEYTAKPFMKYLTKIS